MDHDKLHRCNEISKEMDRLRDELIELREIIESAGGTASTEYSLVVQGGVGHPGTSQRWVEIEFGAL